MEEHEEEINEEVALALPFPPNPLGRQEEPDWGSEPWERGPEPVYPDIMQEGEERWAGYAPAYDAEDSLGDALPTISRISEAVPVEEFDMCEYFQNEASVQFQRQFQPVWDPIKKEWVPGFELFCNNPVSHIVSASQPKPVVPFHNDPEVGIIAVKNSIMVDAYVWEDVIQRFNELEAQGFPQLMEDLPEEEEELIHDWENQAWEHQWNWNLWDSDPLDGESLPQLFPGSETLGDWEKPEEPEWDPEPNAWQLGKDPNIQEVQEPIEYDEEGYPTYLNRRVLGGVIPAMLRLGDAVALEEFDPVGFMTPEDNPRPAVPFVDSADVNTLNPEPADDWWEKDEPVAVVVGDEVWAVNPSMVVGGLWDVPFQIPSAPLSPAESRIMGKPVQSIEPICDNMDVQNLDFWEGLSLEDLGGNAATRVDEADAAIIRKGKRKVGEGGDIWQ